MHDIALSCAALLYMCRYIRPKHIEPGAVPAMEPDAVPAIPGLTFERPLRLVNAEIEDAREVVGNSTKKRRIRPARPGDDALCGEVIEVVLRHGADVRVVRCLFGLRKQDRVFIEGTQENITFVVRAIKSDYESGRMTGKKWKSRDAENADAAAHDDDDDCETQPEHEGEHE